MRWGIRAIIGESFADIFYSNCIAIGVPCFTLPQNSIQDIQNLSGNKCLFLEIDLNNSSAKSKELNIDLEENKNASILIVNSNFGCGSSREHAPQALMRWGIKAIIGESFADIFYSNCIAIGIPCFTLPKKSIEEMQNYCDNQFLFLEIDLKKSLAKSNDLNLNLEIRESSRKMFLSGEWDATSTLLDNENLIENKFSQLPYIKFNSHYSQLSKSK